MSSDREAIVLPSVDLMHLFVGSQDSIDVCSRNGFGICRCGII